MAFVISLFTSDSGILCIVEAEVISVAGLRCAGHPHDTP